MGKIQKSLLLNEDLIVLLDAHARRTGASFTRQLTAAVLQYLFGRPEGPDPEWMSVATGLDEGTLTIDDILQGREDMAFAQADFVNGLVMEPGSDDVQAALIADAERAVEGWGAMREPARTAALVRIMRYWKEQNKRVAKFKDREVEPGTDTDINNG